jgi:hypothetical protein
LARSSTTFKPGRSGNPKGRRPGSGNPELSEIRHIAREYGSGCITLLAGMAGLVPGQPPAEAEPCRIAAVKELLDRGYGKATQPLANDTNQPLLIDFRWASDPPPAAAISPPVIEAAAEPVDAESDDDEIQVIWQTGEAAD